MSNEKCCIQSEPNEMVLRDKLDRIIGVLDVSLKLTNEIDGKTFEPIPANCGNCPERVETHTIEFLIYKVKELASQIQEGLIRINDRL
jgi:hypothetical protein